MTGPIKLDITDDGEVVIAKEFEKEKHAEEAREEEELYRKDPENYVYKCFHGQKCKYVIMEKEPFPSMRCKITGEPITLEAGCPHKEWEWRKEKTRKQEDFDWYRRNRRLHYERCAEEWKKRYGSTRKLPDFIVAGMQ